MHAGHAWGSAPLPGPQLGEGLPEGGQVEAGRDGVPGGGVGARDAVRLPAARHRRRGSARGTRHARKRRHHSVMPWEYGDGKAAAEVEGGEAGVEDGGVVGGLQQEEEEVEPAPQRAQHASVTIAAGDRRGFDCGEDGEEEVWRVGIDVLHVRVRCEEAVTEESTGPDKYSQRASLESPLCSGRSEDAVNAFEAALSERSGCHDRVRGLQRQFQGRSGCALNKWRRALPDQAANGDGVVRGWYLARTGPLLLYGHVLYLQQLEAPCFAADVLRWG